MDSRSTSRGSWSFRFIAMLMLFVVLGVLALQLPWISRPPFDAHSFRQAQTLATIELFAKDGIDLAHARTNYTGEPGYFVLELPLFQAICALLYKWFGPHVWFVRLTNLLFVFGNAGLIFSVGKRLFSRNIGLYSAIIYLFAPLNLLYMTSTLIDPSATFTSLAAFLFALRILWPEPDENPDRALNWGVFAMCCILTALIKALYLFPTCMLLAGTFLARRKLSTRLLAAGLCVGGATGLFFVWLMHCREINNASYFTQGVSPTTLLRFDALASPIFYENIARRVLIHVVGPAGAALALAAACVTWTQRDKIDKRHRFGLLVLGVSFVAYYPPFPTAHAHDYYSLVISPYACMIAGVGVESVQKCAARTTSWFRMLGRPALITALTVLASVVVYLKPVIFSSRPRLTPDPYLVELQELGKGLFVPGAFAMIFVGPDPRYPAPSNIGADMPQALYAVNLRGTSRLFTNAPSVIAAWNEFRPHYRHLEYVLFYGLPPPPEIVQHSFVTIVSNDSRQWYAYRVNN